MIRLIIGISLAPVAGLLVGVIALNVAHPEGFGWLDGPISRSAAALMYLIVMWPMAFGGMIILGWPTSRWLTKRGITSVVLYGLLGALFGLITPAFIITIMQLLKHHAPTLRFALLPYGVLQPISVGITTSLVFWLISVRNKTGTTMGSRVPSTRCRVP